MAQPVLVVIVTAEPAPLIYTVVLDCLNVTTWSGGSAKR
jgi:hypothetical protein